MFNLLTPMEEKSIAQATQDSKVAARVYSQMNFATDTQSGVGNKTLAHCASMSRTKGGLLCIEIATLGIAL